MWRGLCSVQPALLCTASCLAAVAEQQKKTHRAGFMARALLKKHLRRGERDKKGNHRKGRVAG